MAKDSDPLAGAFETKESGGILSGLLAEENEFDRRTMWRLGSWGVAAVGAIVVAVMANQAQLGWRRDQVASADLARQAERLAVLTRESQIEARRLTAAIETLNSDRDRLYTRVTVLEQGLDSVTGAIAKQSASPAQKPEPSSAPAPQAAAPAVAPVASTPANDKPAKEATNKEATNKEAANKEAASKEAANKDAANKEAANRETAKERASPPQQAAAAAPSASTPAASELPAIPLVAAKSMMAPPDPAASKLMQPEKSEQPKDQSQPTDVATASPTAAPETESEAQAITVQQTRFAVDLGSANSVPGLRALWRGLTKSNPDLAKLRPIIMVKESKTGLGMQLRLGAGPLVNAAAAAKICAGLSENDRSCETAVFDGQRLSMQGQEKAQDASPKEETKAETPPPPAAKPEKPHRRSYSSKRSKREEPPPPPAAAPAKPETSSTLSSFFSRR